MKNKCIIILSVKSSGSSACQNFLCKSSKVRHLSKTRHGENETLYWTKAASLLELPQINMIDSEVPIKKEKAKADLLKLLHDNIDSYTPPENDIDFVFDGWRNLCEKFNPVYLEKSPHHLLQWSNLELIQQFIESKNNVDIHIIGLVRNPMDTLYSAWSRWGTIPELNQTEWVIAYNNLFQLKELLGDQVHIVKYEDMVKNPDTLIEEFKFIGDTESLPDQRYFHKKSVSKWKSDNNYGFNLSSEAISLARKYGYSDDDLLNTSKTLWVYYKRYYRAIKVISKWFVKFKNKAKGG